jgi:adenylyltransferase/sulfurtransferase
MLNEHDKLRYSRHLIMPQVGAEGQTRLKNSRVLIIGAGGLGCPVLQYLAAAGVGYIALYDNDVVEESNLQRQVLYTPEDIGKFKAQIAADKLNEFNPGIEVHGFARYLENKEAYAVIPSFDVVIDGTDNFSTRYMVNDACVIHNKPLIYGAIYKFEGQISVFNYKGGATYRCLYPDPPLEANLPNCAETGVLGVLPGFIGTAMAAETLKVLLELPGVLSNKVLFFNLLNWQNYTLEFQPDIQAIEKVRNSAGAFQVYDYAGFCTSRIQKFDDSDYRNVNIQDAITLVQQHKYILLDVREQHELPELPAWLPKKVLPTSVFNTKGEEAIIEAGISAQEAYIVCCARGVRSKKVIEVLLKQGFRNLCNLEAGVLGYDIMKINELKNGNEKET